MSVFRTKKYRKFFPRKGPEKKALMFLSNLSKLDPERAKQVYRKVLKEKFGYERQVLINARRVFSSRKNIFQKYSSLVEEYRKKEPSFWGVIVFGGTVKKPTIPTDLDFIFVGKISDKGKTEFCRQLSDATGFAANPFPAEVDLESDPKRFETLLSIPYLHAPEEWAVQNFVGPQELRRKVMKSYASALKNIKPARIPKVEK